METLTKKKGTQAAAASGGEKSPTVCVCVSGKNIHTPQG